MNTTSDKPFIDGYVWIVPRYVQMVNRDGSSSYKLEKIYYYNSLETPLKDVTHLNDIHIPENLIGNLTPEIKELVLNNKNEGCDSVTHIKTNNNESTRNNRKN